MSTSGVSKGTFARVVPPGEAVGGGRCLGSEDSVRGCSQVPKETVSGGVKGCDIGDGGDGERAEMGGPSIAKEGVHLPPRGRGEGGGDVGGRDGEKKPRMIRTHRVVKRDHALRWVVGVGKEGVIHEDVVDEGGACARSAVGDGTRRDGGDQSRRIKPLFKLVVPTRRGNVRGGPKGGMGIKVSAK